MLAATQPTCAPSPADVSGGAAAAHGASQGDRGGLGSVLRDLVKPGDENLREMNKKLQNMLEEQLTKNMHLQKVSKSAGGPGAPAAERRLSLCRTWSCCPRNWSGSARTAAPAAARPDPSEPPLASVPLQPLASTHPSRSSAASWAYGNRAGNRRRAHAGVDLVLGHPQAAVSSFGCGFFFVCLFFLSELEGEHSGSQSERRGRVT